MKYCAISLTVTVFCSGVSTERASAKRGTSPRKCTAQAAFKASPAAVFTVFQRLSLPVTKFARPVGVKAAGTVTCPATSLIPLAAAANLRKSSSTTEGGFNCVRSNPSA